MEYKLGQLIVKGGLTYAYNPVTLMDYMTPNYAYGTKLTQPTLVPNVEQKIYKFKLKLKCRVEQNQRIAVIGSIPELGNWQELVCFMKLTEGNIWVLEQPHIQTMEPHFTYKYVLLEDDRVLRKEAGIDRIADLELLPDLTAQT